MKWGYTDGKRNGKRTASELSYEERVAAMREEYEKTAAASGKAYEERVAAMDKKYEKTAAAMHEEYNKEVAAQKARTKKIAATFLDPWKTVTTTIKNIGKNTISSISDLVNKGASYVSNLFSN